MSARLAIGAVTALAGLAALGRSLSPGGSRAARASGLSAVDEREIQRAAEIHNRFLRRLIVKGGFAKAGDPRLYALDPYTLDEWLFASNENGWVFSFPDLSDLDGMTLHAQMLKSEGIDYVGMGGYRYAIRLPDSGHIAKLPLHSEGADGIEMEVHAWANSRAYAQLRRHLLPVLNTGRIRTRSTQDKTIPFLVMPWAQTLSDAPAALSISDQDELAWLLSQRGFDEAGAEAEAESFLDATGDPYPAPDPAEGGRASTDPRLNPEVVICTRDIRWDNLAIHQGRLVLLDYQCI